MGNAASRKKSRADSRSCITCHPGSRGSRYKEALVLAAPSVAIQNGGRGSILACENSLCSLSEVTKRCYQEQVRVSEKLRELANELDREELDMKKAKVGLAVIGSTFAVAGFGLSFVTLGASLVLTIVGASVAAVSGTGAVATSIAEKIIKNKKIKDANLAILSYTRAIMELAPLLEHFCDSLSTREEKEKLRSILTDTSLSSDSVSFTGIRNEDNLCQTCATGHKIITTALRVQQALGMKGLVGTSGRTSSQVTRWTLGMLTEVSSFSKEAFASIHAASRVIRIGGAALFGVGLVIDVGTIVYFSIKIHNKQPSEVAQLFRTIAEAFGE